MLEIFYNGTWGTVCDDSFDDIDAQVACRQLGYKNQKKIFKRKIWLDDVDCSGAEKKLSHCTHAGWGVENCFRGENVKIKCNNATEGVLRNSSGKLEILHNNEWGTVCSSNFNKIEAEVACKQLGYRNGSVLENTIATGASKIWLNILACNGNESKLIDCSHSDWDTDTCSHGHVVGIRCFEGKGRNLGDFLRRRRRLSTEQKSLEAMLFRLYRLVIDLKITVLISCANKEQQPMKHCVMREVISPQKQAKCDVRLNSSRLEIYYNGTWGTVCYYLFDDRDAIVACRQLGYSNGMSLGNKVDAGTGRIWQSYMNCNGIERTLADCSHDTWRYSYCDHHGDVGIECLNGNEGDLRILSPNSVLEVLHNNEWGKVCYDYFDNIDATVACRQLGYRNICYIFIFTFVIHLEEITHCCTVSEFKLVFLPHFSSTLHVPEQSDKEDKKENKKENNKTSDADDETSESETGTYATQISVKINNALICERKSATGCESASATEREGASATGYEDDNRQSQSIIYPVVDPQK
ncbi:unnamed protein product [Mytilus coruscus]|uniref:SRCR domain-containing protein n=1 Tax=Mytilus coruscus TaxID=42192 RepID=A0A6J8E7Q8_MYTCO|nr:unnamed protein product [Mytilus coruscus]